MRVLSVTHGPSVPGGVFDEVVEATEHRLERWSVPDSESPDPAQAYDAVMVFGGSAAPGGIQFHAEVTLPMATAWASEDTDDQGRALCAASLREAAAG